jgi:hypothetical protein
LLQKLFIVARPVGLLPLVLAPSFSALLYALLDPVTRLDASTGDMARASSEGPLQAELRKTTVEAADRAAEGQEIFSPIAAFLDAHRIRAASLPARAQCALASLSDELAAVAGRHFSAYVSGGFPELYAQSAPSRPPSPPQSRPPSGLAKSTYAAAVRANSPLSASTLARPGKPSKRAAPPQPLAPDNRLFVRLPEDHHARGMDGYAILSGLRAQLGTDAGLLKEVQVTKTGFALCPASPDALKTLEARKDSLKGFFRDCHIERGSRWVSYRVTNVPRKVGQILDDGSYGLVPVHAQAVVKEVTEATGIPPVAAVETRFSASNPALPFTSWFVNFPEGTTATIPRQLRLFGASTTARHLPRKTSVVQCTRCWMWHNARSCARPPRCRQCGSTEHQEGHHPNRCDAAPPHLCPPRCLHCHGPHPADAADCLLRPKAGRSFTKLQKSEVRSTGSANLARARTEAGCVFAPVQEQMAVDTPEETGPPALAPLSCPFPPRVSTPRAGTPPPPSPLRTAPSTTRLVRFDDRLTGRENPFSALSTDEEL